MKLGSLTFEEAVKKLHDTHAIMCDQLGEFVSIRQDGEVLDVYPQAGDDLYQFIKTQNESVDVCVAKNGIYHYQYMRMFTEDGDEMDFILYQPAPIITMDSLLHPVS